MTVMRYRQLVLLYLLSSTVLPVVAETQDFEALDIEAITKKWKCKYCPDLSEQQWQGYFSLGTGYVSNSSYKFGEYNSLNEKGVYLSGDLKALYRDEKGNYVDVKGENLGLDSSYFAVEGGRQGKYKVKLEVDQISRYALDTSRTPYSSSGSSQTLPAGWVNASTTAGFTTLNNDLQAVNLYSRRRHFKLGGKYIYSPRWSYETWFKRQIKKANQDTAFSFGFNRAVILPQTIDYTTDEIELKANYNVGDFNSQLALTYSSFKNTNKAFRWDNAYDLPTSTPQGQAATAPDNTMQQILLSASYSGIKKLQLTGLVSYARLEQNEAYLPYTVNTGLGTTSLPQNSVNAKVAVFNTNLAAYWQYSPRQAWRLSYQHHEQVNETARSTFSYVTTDNTITGTPRANTPYSFRNRKLKLKTDYKFANKIKLSGGGQLFLLDRTYQSVEQTRETSLWAKLKQRIDNTLQYSIKTEYNDRKIDNYNVLSEVIPAENPRMRKYNMADRKGYKAKINLAYSLSDAILFNFFSDVAQYDYDTTTLGLTSSDELSLGLDIQYIVNKDLSFTGFIQNTEIKSQQAGSQSYSTADWYANNEDKVLTLGVGSNYVLMADKLKIGADYVYTSSRSSINVSSGAAFPALTTRRDRIVLYADYNIDETLAVKLSYQYEQYRENNWYTDNVEPNTLTNVLTLGQAASSYKIGVIWLSLRYKF